jgi:signal peptidase I
MAARIREILHGKAAGNVVLLFLVLAGAYFFLAREARFFRIPSSSMEATLFPVDHIVTMADGTYGRGDIVVLRESEHPSDFFVKRIVGVGGDAISVRMGALHVNGEYASEPYIMESMEYEISAPVVVPEEHVFVLGDNRNNSSDSHDALETFPVDMIVGRVRFIYYPYDRFGTVSPFPLTNRLGQ